MQFTIVLAHGAFAESASWDGVVGISHAAETAQLINQATASHAYATA